MLETSLTVYGPLGLLALAASTVALHLWKALQAEREAHRKQIDEMVERYVASSDKQVEKYHDLASSMQRVLESLERRFK